MEYTEKDLENLIEIYQRCLTQSRIMLEHCELLKKSWNLYQFGLGSMTEYSKNPLYELNLFAETVKGEIAFNQDRIKDYREQLTNIYLKEAKK